MKRRLLLLAALLLVACAAVVWAFGRRKLSDYNPVPGMAFHVPFPTPAEHNEAMQGRSRGRTPAGAS